MLFTFLENKSRLCRREVWCLKDKGQISTVHMIHTSGITTSEIRDVFHSWNMQPTDCSSRKVIEPQANNTEPFQSGSHPRKTLQYVPISFLVFLMVTF
jgi:hypothetical protein